MNDGPDPKGLLQDFDSQCGGDTNPEIRFRKCLALLKVTPMEVTPLALLEMLPMEVTPLEMIPMEVTPRLALLEMTPMALLKVTYLLSLLRNPRRNVSS